MRVSDIKEGKTYRGRGGRLRTVTERADSNNGLVCYTFFEHGTTCNSLCKVRSFARWAIKEAKA